MLEESLQLYHKILVGNWDVRFAQVELICLMEVNRIANLITHFGQIDLMTKVDKRIYNFCDVDLRVTMQWDTDKTDIELHVIEPTGDTCYSFHNKTKIGGMLSRDFTYGYGPEEYLLHRAIPGEYTIFAKLYSSIHNPRATTVLLSITTNFGRPQHEKTIFTHAILDQPKLLVKIATVTF